MKMVSLLLWGGPVDMPRPESAKPSRGLHSLIRAGNL
jgi:hypothetical protein